MPPKTQKKVVTKQKKSPVEKTKPTNRKPGKSRKSRKSRKPPRKSRTKSMRGGGGVHSVLAYNMDDFARIRGNYGDSNFIGAYNPETLYQSASKFLDGQTALFAPTYSDPMRYPTAQLSSVNDFSQQNTQPISSILHGKIPTESSNLFGPITLPTDQYHHAFSNLYGAGRHKKRRRKGL